MRMDEQNEKVDKPTSRLADQDLQAKCEEYLAGWKRALADYDNLKKDLVREKGLLRAAVQEECLLRLIPVLDHFEQAVRFKPASATEDVEKWLQGILQIRSQLEDVMRGLGAEPYGRDGEPFDPLLHESASSRRDPEKPDHQILEVVSRGWKLGERVIRPARVVINSL